MVFLKRQKTTEHPYSTVNLAVLQPNNIASIEVIYQKIEAFFSSANKQFQRVSCMRNPRSKTHHAVKKLINLRIICIWSFSNLGKV